MSKSMTTSSPLFVPAARPWRPHKYQERAVKFGLKQSVAGFFLSPGLGKTSIMLAIIKVLRDKGLMGRVLIVAPLRVCYLVWPAELEKWSDFSGLTCAVLHGSKKLEALHSGSDICIINPEGLKWLVGPVVKRAGNRTSVKVDVAEFKRLGFDTLVVDELTQFKNYASIRFKLMRPLLQTFSRRYGLTGSPAANGLMGLFGQLYMLDGGRSLGSYITHYRRNYFVKSANGFSYDLQPGAEARIYQRIKPVVLRMSDDEYLSLPALVEDVLRVELPPRAMGWYKQLEDDLLAKIDDGVVTAKNAGVALGKCRQLAGGAVYEDEELGEPVKTVRPKRKWLEVHRAKLDLLAELIDELQGAPAMVAYEFHHDLERIRATLGKATPYIGAGISAKETQRLADQWNRGELPVLLVHPVSVAHGLNLQGGGQHVIWFTLTWDYERYDQLIRRLRRQGSKHGKVFSHVLLADGTVDEAVLASLHGKERGQNALFRALQAKINGR